MPPPPVLDSPAYLPTFLRTSLNLLQAIVVVATKLRQNTNYVQLYVIYMNLIFNGIIPLMTLVILNTLVYRRLKALSQCVEAPLRSSSVQWREVMLAKVSCLIVAGEKGRTRTIFIIFVLSVFIVCHSVRWIPNIFELQQGTSNKVGDISEYSKMYFEIMTTNRSI